MIMGDPLKADAIAGDQLQEALKNSLAGEEVVPIAGTAYIQANVTAAALFGLIRMLAHKNVIGEEELARSIAWAYNERRIRVQEQQRDGDSSLIWVPPVSVRPRN
jgi:hypothetical protein